jgi:hypothetical protein
MTTQFQVGRTYSIRSICDYECIYSFTILSRTAKTVSVSVYGTIVRRRVGIDEKAISVSVYGTIVRRRVGIDEKGIEYFMPYGSYELVRASDPDLSEV